MVHDGRREAKAASHRTATADDGRSLHPVGTAAKTIFVASPGATAGLLRASGGDVVWAAQQRNNTPAWVINSMGATASAPTVVARAESHTTYQTTWENLVRLPSGSFQDDVGVVVVREAH